MKVMRKTWSRRRAPVFFSSSSFLCLAGPKPSHITVLQHHHQVIRASEIRTQNPKRRRFHIKKVAAVRHLRETSSHWLKRYWIWFDGIVQVSLALYLYRASPRPGGWRKKKKQGDTSTSLYTCVSDDSTLKRSSRSLLNKMLRAIWITTSSCPVIYLSRWLHHEDQWCWAIPVTFITTYLPAGRVESRAARARILFTRKQKLSSTWKSSAWRQV